ncbi:MAG: helix-turn-helix transcriptional regulator [Planctomycetes bacterium]|nr:helix-turn-helix transcriptional regulator [Planctomycetota bacterium]
MLQETVAEQLRFPVRSLSRWEQGEADLGASKLAALAELYGVSMDWIAGRTPLRHCVQPGAVLFDPARLDELEALANSGANIYDVPRRLVRPPGVNCAAVVPENAEVISEEAADLVEARMREIWKRLGGRVR